MKSSWSIKPVAAIFAALWIHGLLLDDVTAAGPQPSSIKKPNIVMVFIDDMGWGDFSCFGNLDAQTLNVDRLAAEGLRFSQFYVNAPICSPSRCALTTGQYPHRWRITSFLNNRKDNERRGVANWLDPQAPTIANLLRSNGYATGHFGKWHLGGQRDVDDAPSIASYGFDESLTNFEGMGAKLLPMTQKPGDSKPGKIWADAERLGGPVIWKQRSEITGGFIDAAIPFMDRAARAEKPFFVNLWPDDVHSPYWPSIDNWKDGSRRKLYLSVLEEMDKQLGRMFDYIRSQEALRNNTLVLICSDNGPDIDAGNAGPFRGTKATLYEGGIRSPLIVWGPGIVNSAQTGILNERSVFSAMDLVPSILDIANVSVPREIRYDGENLSSVIRGESQSSRKAPLFWRRPPDRKMAYGAGPLPDLSVRDGEWKLLCEYDGSQAELYNLVEDMGETHNVASDHPEIVRRLTNSVITWHQSMPPDSGPTLGMTLDAESKQNKQKVPK